MYASVRLFSGQTPPERTLLSSITDAKDTRFLFIAAENVEKEPQFGALYHDAVPERSALWIVPGAGHTQGLSVATQEYVSRVIAFFDETLLAAE
jgi:hypothetical protein